MLHQVAGRAGRAEIKGSVYLQTFNPDSRIVQALALGERDNFLEVEMGERKAANMPPYSRLAGIIISGRDEAEVDALARELGRTAPQGNGVRTYGPAQAQIARLRGRHRRRLLVVAEKQLEIQKALAAWINSLKIPTNIKVTVDIDPQSFL
jgi:primosomal protein N' (replication factor Y)